MSLSRVLALAASAVLTVSLASMASADAIKRTTDPALSPDGKTIAFAWQGDIWTVPIEGGMATRLTIHPADEGWPTWTPDGKNLLFTSNRTGNNDIYIMSATGTGLRRLSYESSNDNILSVSPDGKFVYGYTNAWGRLNLFRLPLTGGDLQRLTMHPLEPQFYGDISPDGTLMAYNAGGSAGHWRKPNMTGSNTSEVWIGTVGAPLTNLRQVTRNQVSDDFPRFLSQNELLVMSNRDGVQNLWRIPVNGSGGRKVTNFTSGTMRALTVSRSAMTAAFQKDSVICTTDLRTGQSKPVAIDAPEDARRNMTPELNLQQGVEDYVPSPNGKRMALEIRGDIFVMPESGGTTRRLTTNPGPDSNPIWLDDQTILYVAAEANGKRTFKTVKLDGTVTDRLSDAKDIMGMRRSPDGQWIAFHRGDRELCVVPAAGGPVTVVATGDFSNAYTGGVAFSWSPDSAWLAVNRALLRSHELVVVSRDGKTTLPITRVGKGLSPAIWVNSRTLAYAGIEGLDYDETRGATGVPLFVVDLLPQPVTFTEDDLDKIDETPAKPDTSVTVRIEQRGLRSRIRRVSAESIAGYWPSADGRSIYANVDGVFSQIALPSLSVRPVTGVTGPVSSVLATRTKVYFTQTGRLFSLGQAGPVPHAFNARYTINVQAEEDALFTEAWWALDRMFYDPTMHGKSWPGIKAEFAQIVPFVTSRADFYALIGEMVERLDSSHQGATSPESFRSEAPETTAWLGVEWNWAQVAQGRFVVDRVYENTPAAHPDSLLQKGDVILAVNGVAPSATSPMAVLMRDQAGRKVRLRVERAGTPVDITIRPASPLIRSGVLYDDWVAWQKSEVDRLSKGQLGYIHIQGMDAPSLGVFLREIATELEGKKGVVLDVRFNGGGFTSHIILNIMRKEPWLLRTSRDLPGFKVSENQFRGNALELPAALLTNEYSFSNAEIFSEGFRRMKLGPVIGEPTAGGVIGTGAYGLWDGGSIRMPGSGAFAMNGENLEGNGRKPDIDVPYDPVMWMQGRDNQLERAVEALLRTLR